LWVNLVQLKISYTCN